MVSDMRMKGIHDDLEHTAEKLEQVATTLAGHARYLQHSVHAQDAADMQGRIAGLQASIDDLRDVAQSIEQQQLEQGKAPARLTQI